MKTNGTDFVVVGAGAFGVWIGLLLRRRGHSVLLVDAHGAGNNRSSSGDESRVIRSGYGCDRLYTRWATRSLELWQELFRAIGRDLFIKTGVLWLGTESDLYTQELLSGLAAEEVAHEKLSLSEITKRFPQIGLDRVSFGVYEPESGVILARRAVQAVLDEAVRLGVRYLIDEIVPPGTDIASLQYLQTSRGDKLFGETFIFACGAWLPQLFPELLGSRIFPTRQEVFFFGAPSGSHHFRPPTMPVWLHHRDEVYGLPDIENRGIKIASDRHGERMNPETDNRLVSEESLRQMQAYLRERLPQLQDAPLLETRVCQYENTSNGDFLIDRHPEIGNAWLVGGGSGHGFKHGPAVGQHVTQRIFDGLGSEVRFSLESKLQVQQRAIY
jgi:sarcosine oxidase